jgi:hypothetical protein
VFAFVDGSVGKRGFQGGADAVLAIGALLTPDDPRVALFGVGFVLVTEGRTGADRLQALDANSGVGVVQQPRPCGPAVVTFGDDDVEVRTQNLLDPGGGAAVHRVRLCLHPTSILLQIRSEANRQNALGNPL